jgi:hypothetical protein
MFTHSLFSRHFSWFWSVAIKTKIAPDVLVREFWWWCKCISPNKKPQGRIAQSQWHTQKTNDKLTFNAGGYTVRRQKRLKRFFVFYFLRRSFLLKCNFKLCGCSITGWFFSQMTSILLGIFFLFHEWPHISTTLSIFPLSHWTKLGVLCTLCAAWNPQQAGCGGAGV